MPIDHIPTTNNHLESFNSHFKDVYIKQFQRGGSQLRVDTLCVSLISFITPNLIRWHNLQQRLNEELQNRRSYFVTNEQENYDTAVQKNYKQYAYFEENVAKDNAAKRIFSSGRIQNYEYSADELYVWVKSETKSNSVYTVCLAPIEEASCQCLDFIFRGGACKHMRAAILCINWIRQEPSNQHLPHISLPTIEEIQALHVNESTEETMQNEVYNIEEFINIEKLNEDDESDKEFENSEDFQLNNDDSLSTLFFDFQNTNSFILQEQEFHVNCHAVLNHLNNLKEISKFFNNFDSRNIIQNDKTIEQFEEGKNLLNELVKNDSLEKVYLAFQQLNIQKQNNAHNTTKSIKKNPSSSDLTPLSPNKKQPRHTSYSTL